MKEKILITGIGVVSALGIGKEALLDGLKEGLSGIKDLAHLNTDELFTSGGEVAEISDEMFRCDRAFYMLQIALQEALIDRGEGMGNLCVGAVVGSAQGGLRTGEKIHHLYAQKAEVPQELWCEYPLNRLLYHINQQIQLSGPELVVSNACVSSTMALGVAMDVLQEGLADVMIVAGVDTMSRFVSAGFQSLKAITNDVCRPFDKERDGIIPGEGAGVLVLEREGSRCRKHRKIYAELSGYGSAADAVHMTAPDKEGSGSAQAIRMALKQAQLRPEQIDFIIPHGTGTLYNDAMEYTALVKVFGETLEKIPVSSIKPTLGHTMGAAGVLSAITAIMAIQHSFLPANLNYQTPDVQLPLHVVTRPKLNQTNRHVMFMTSAFGGSNAVAILSNPDLADKSPKKVVKFTSPDARKRIVISGVGIISNFGIDKETFLENVTSTDIQQLYSDTDLKTAINLLRREPAFAQFNLSGWRLMDEVSRFAVLVSLQAVLEAGIDLTAIDPAQFGVFFGTIFGCLESNIKFHEKLLTSSPRFVSRTTFTNTVFNAAVGQIGLSLGAKGMHLTIASGGVHPLVYGIQQIRKGRVTQALVGGMDKLDPIVIEGFKKTGLVDSSGTGMVVQDGAGALLMENLTDCQRRKGKILAEIVSYGVGGDFELTMREALNSGRISHDQVELVITNETGSQWDLAERKAIENIFESRLPTLYPMKKLIGQTFGAGLFWSIIAALGKLAANQLILINSACYDTRSRGTFILRKF